MNTLMIIMMEVLSGLQHNYISQWFRYSFFYSIDISNLFFPFLLVVCFTMHDCYQKISGKASVIIKLFIKLTYGKKKQNNFVTDWVYYCLSNRKKRKKTESLYSTVLCPILSLKYFQIQMFIQDLTTITNEIKRMELAGTSIIPPSSS